MLAVKLNLSIPNMCVPKESMDKRISDNELQCHWIEQLLQVWEKWTCSKVKNVHKMLIQVNFNIWNSCLNISGMWRGTHRFYGIHSRSVHVLLMYTFRAVDWGCLNYSLQAMCIPKTWCVWPVSCFKIDIIFGPQTTLKCSYYCKREVSLSLYT